ATTRRALIEGKRMKNPCLPKEKQGLARLAGRTGADCSARPKRRRSAFFLVCQSNAQVVVVGAFGNTEPRHNRVTEAHVVVVNLLEHRILVAEFLLQNIGGLEGLVHHVARESFQYRTAGDQATQCAWALGVVLGDHALASTTRGNFNQG